MSFVANRQSTPSVAAAAEGYAWPSPDSLYDYVTFIQEADGSEKLSLAELPEAACGTKVAVIGAGPAGLCVAYELLKVGFAPVVFEATDRIGGRNYSKPFVVDGVDTAAIAEMGAMRFPPINKVLFHYAQLLGIDFTPDFPDPGHVLTQLYYSDRSYRWEPGEPPPGPFEQIATQWGQFVSPLQEALQEAYGEGLVSVQSLWQRYIDRYKDSSFHAAVVAGIPAWGPEELNAFGALGVGSGGFGPLYQVGFLEMLRIILGLYETDQELVPGGISQLPDGLYRREVDTPLGRCSLESTGAVRVSSPVTSIAYDQATGDKLVTVDDGDPERFPAVVVATTSRAMSFMGLTLPTPAAPQGRAVDPGQLIGPVPREAIRNLHLMNSSKMFIATERKFWLDDTNLPRNIQTDELPRGVYCLDYPGTDHGVVLISYTWGDDSSKLLGVPPEERFALFRKTIARINPDFAKHLEPLGGQIFNVDWEAEDHYYGAFKLNYPGQDVYTQAAYYQFLDVLGADDRGLYLAGDSISWYGGWTEGALETALNAVAAVCKHFDAELPADSPLIQQRDRYTY